MPNKKIVFSSISSLCLIIVATWWIFFISWSLGLVRTIQSVALRVTPTSLVTEIVRSGTQRAHDYVIKGITPQSDIFFTNDEIGHLLDVARVYQTIRIALGIAAIASLLWLIFMSLKKTGIGKESFIVAKNILFSGTVFLLISLILFRTFFNIFHQLLFPQGNWTFPPNSTLIQLFPESFWFIYLGWILGSTMCFGFFYHLMSREQK